MTIEHAKSSDEKRSVRTTVSIPADAYVEVERIAQQNKVSIAWVIRDAVEEYLTQRTPLFQDH